jgi:D-ribose pyranose/furanose isomerase RbsD
MSIENRNKLLQSISNNESLGIFSPNGLSLNSTYGSIDIAFKQGIISNIDNISIIGNEHNIKKYQITFFDINNEIINERFLETDQNEILSIDNVAIIRIIFLETIDNKTINNVKLSIRGCFFKIRNFKPPKSSTIKPPKPPGYCHSIDLMNKHHAKRLFNRIGGTLNIPEIYNSTEKMNQSLFFIVEFNKNVFIQNLQNISILTKNHSIQQIRIELHNKNRQLLKRIDLSMFEQTINTNLYEPLYPIDVKYLKVTILKGEINENITWSIIGCFNRLKKIKTIIKTLKFAWWTGKIFYHSLKNPCIFYLNSLLYSFQYTRWRLWLSSTKIFNSIYHWNTFTNRW